MKDREEEVLFVTDKNFVDYDIAGGVQICTAEFITYLTKAGFSIAIFKVEPVITAAKKLKLRLGVEAYDLYNIDHQIPDVINVIISKNIKFVFINQINLAQNIAKIKGKVPADVKFIGLSHGNESGDYLHEITRGKKASFLNTWRLGKLIIKENFLFSKLLDGLITISNHETYINQWLGADNILFLPRILNPNFIDHKPAAKTIGFAGTLNHLPNLLGIELLSERLQLKGFSGILRLVGGPANTGQQLEEKFKFIQYCGMLNSRQLIDEVSTWSLFLSPVFWYARGSSTKLAQALNWGIPVITTPAGARGYDLSNQNIIAADNLPETFADTIIKVLGSNDMLQELKLASHNSVTHFDINKWVSQLVPYLHSL